MDRHMLNSGFTVLEMLAVIMILSLMMILFPMQKCDTDMSEKTFVPDYLLAQSAAIASSERTQLPQKDGYPSVSFNARGNVSKAMTFAFSKTGRQIIIELGGGRLVFR